MRIRSERIVKQLSVDDLTVRKSALDLDRDNVVGIKLELSTAADHPVAVELVEAFPGHFSMGDVQVHPSYRPEVWTTDEARHRLVLEAELDPGSSLETVYGVRVNDAEREAFLGEPAALRVEPVGGDGGADASAGTPRREPRPSTPEPTSDEGPEDAPPTPPDGPGADDAAAGAAGDQPSSSVGAAGPPAAGRPASAAEPSAAATEPSAETGPAGGGFEFGEDRRQGHGAAAGGSGVDATGGDGSASVGGADGGDPGGSGTDDVAALVERLARSDLSEAQRRRIAAAVGVGADGRAGERVAEPDSAATQLAGMAEAFDQVVNAVGSSAEAVVALDGAHEALAEDVEALSTRAEAAAGERDALRGRVETLEAAVDDLRESHAGDVSDLDARIEELETVFEDSGELDAIREVIAAERAWRERSAAGPTIGSRSVPPRAGDR